MQDDERFFHQVRLIQRRTKCSNYVCNEFVRAFKNKKNGGRTIDTFDTKAARAAGVEYFVLHGCPKCNKYVYKPSDSSTHCPFPKQDGTVCGHPRYKTAKEPWEVYMFYYAFVRSLLC